MDLKLVLIIIVSVGLLFGIVGWLAWRWSRKEAKALLTRVGRLPMRDKFVLAWTLLRDERIPLASRAILPGLFIYLALPIDLVPDFIPVLGQLDDIVIALAAVTLLLRATPRSIIEEHLTRLEIPLRPTYEYDATPRVIELPPRSTE